MGIISVEHMERLYWLGRYSERTYTTARLFERSYDRMIDFQPDTYHKFCEQLDIPDIYPDKETFIEQYCFDEGDQNSIYSNLMRAYDNAVVMREQIGSEPLSYLQLAMYDMNLAKKSEAPMMELMRVIDNLLAFWGIVDDQVESDNIRNLIKVGKGIERIDLFARLQVPAKWMRREVSMLAVRIERTYLKYNREKLEKLKELVGEDELCYSSILALVDSLLL